jgi:hypothetical protein
MNIDEETLASFVGGPFDGLKQELGWAATFILIRPCPACRLLGVGAACAEHDLVMEPEDQQLRAPGPFDALYQLAHIEYAQPSRSLYVLDHIDLTPNFHIPTTKEQPHGR